MSHLQDEIHKLPTTQRDLVSLFFGKIIGSGMSRVVYEHISDPSLVFKVELEGNRFQNILEWEVWRAVKDTKYSKWFAPCVDISANGIILVQKKAERIPIAQYPKQIPRFFTDTKYQNFGVIGNQFVCFDYGTVHIDALNRSLTAKLKKADWWTQ